MNRITDLEPITTFSQYICIDANMSLVLDLTKLSMETEKEEEEYKAKKCLFRLTKKIQVGRMDRI